MPLQFRPAGPSDYERLENLAIESFEPISWYREVEKQFGLLRGLDWRGRFQLRFRKVFNTQMVLVGELEGQPVAFASGKIEHETALAFIDLLAVDRRFQRQGLGRQMLRGMLQHLKKQGAVHAYLECLTSNDAGNGLYESEGFQRTGQFAYWFLKVP